MPDHVLLTHGVTYCKFLIKSILPLKIYLNPCFNKIATVIKVEFGSFLDNINVIIFIMSTIIKPVINFQTLTSTKTSQIFVAGNMFPSASCKEQGYLNKIACTHK